MKEMNERAETDMMPDFYERFCSALKANSDTLRNIYNNRSAYTDMIRSIMSKLYEKEEYLYAPEWMTVDYTWWNKPKQFKADGMNIYDWGECLLAVEHENDLNDWTYELAKIDAVRAKTKIVIGYGKKERNRADEIKTIEEQGNYMKHLGDISEDAGEAVYVFLLNSVFDETGEDPFGVATYCLVKKEGKGFVLPF